MSQFTGTRALLRLALRRDRILLPAWMLAYLAYSVGGTAAAIALYPTMQSRVDAASAVNDLPAMLVMYGRVWDPQSLGSVAMMKPIGFGGIFAAILAILLVTRHTRTEEESGRLEVIGSLVVGRWAPLAAALSLVTGVMTVLCAVNALGVIGTGLPAGSAWVWAISVSLCGLVFAAITGVTAQLTQAARAANTLAFMMLALAFLLRGTADAAGTPAASAWWSWLSPVGWQDQVKAFAGDRWWALLPPVLTIALLTPAALSLARHRDLDAGLIPQRSGRASAGPGLRSALSLSLRLQRGLMLGLLVSYLLMALLLGSIASTANRFLDSQQMRDWLLRSAGSSDPFVAFMVFEVGFAGVLSALCGVILARRIGSEEQAGRLEPLLATSASHRRLLGAHIVVALLGTTLLQLALALGFWLGNATQSGNFSGLPEAIARTIVYLPAIWVLVGLAFAVFALLPGQAYLSWVAVAATVLVSEFGTLLSWPSLVLDLSPFTHVPRLPATPMLWTPTLWLLLVSGGLLLLALARFPRRDLATP